MKGNPFLPTPSVLLALTLFSFLGFLLIREAFVEEGLPVFLVKDEAFFYVELVGDIAEPGVYQLSDGAGLSDVIKLTIMSLSVDGAEYKPYSDPLHSGERLQLNGKDPQKATLQKDWMPAAHRIALRIPLHPDRMSPLDWQILPGIGPVLAERIENNRQINGDYGRLEALKRVRGVGPKRIESWREFF